MNNKTLYDILEISESATQDEIKKAFRNLAKQYHPDSESGNEEKFKEINDAYEILSDKDKKKIYDSKLKNNSYSDSFQYENIYDIMRKAKSEFRRNQKKKESRKQLNTTISVFEYINGCQRKFKMKTSDIDSIINVSIPKGISSLNFNAKGVDVTLICDIEPSVNDYYTLKVDERLGLCLYINSKHYSKQININYPELDFHLSFNKPKNVIPGKIIIVYLINDIKMNVILV